MENFLFCAVVVLNELSSPLIDYWMIIDITTRMYAKNGHPVDLLKFLVLTGYSLADTIT